MCEQNKREMSRDMCVCVQIKRSQEAHKNQF